MTIKILNLYAGIGGNRKLWEGDIEVTAVENVPEIAKIYQDFFPNDKVIIADAHQYLLDHYAEFDFIWSSPPCPTHSRMQLIKNNFIEYKDFRRYPDMRLYQEIIFLSCFFKGRWVVENVISYYEPLIKPQNLDNHYFWCNFLISSFVNESREIRDDDIDKKQKRLGIDIDSYKFSTRKKRQLLNNCVNPLLASHIFKMAFKEKQEVLA